MYLFDGSEVPIGCAILSASSWLSEVDKNSRWKHLLDRFLQNMGGATSESELCYYALWIENHDGNIGMILDVISMITLDREPKEAENFSKSSTDISTQQHGKVEEEEVQIEVRCHPFVHDFLYTMNDEEEETRNNILSQKRKDYATMIPVLMANDFKSFRSKRDVHHHHHHYYYYAKAIPMMKPSPSLYMNDNHYNDNRNDKHDDLLFGSLLQDFTAKTGSNNNCYYSGKLCIHIECNYEHLIQNNDYERTSNDDDNNNNKEHVMKQIVANYMKRSLSHQLVKVGCVIVLPISNGCLQELTAAATASVALTGDQFLLLEQQQQQPEVINATDDGMNDTLVLMVTNVVVEEEGTCDNDNSKKQHFDIEDDVCYLVGPDGTFDIILNKNNEGSSTSAMMEHQPTVIEYEPQAQTRQQDGKNNVLSSSSKTSIPIPGYESFLNDLLLPHIVLPSSKTLMISHTMISGSSGVGKTRMIHALKEQLLASKYDTQWHYVSILDLLRQTETSSSSSNDDDIASSIQHLLLPSHFTTTTKAKRRRQELSSKTTKSFRILVLDDLQHLLVGEEGGDTVSGDGAVDVFDNTSERRKALCYAIGETMDYFTQLYTATIEQQGDEENSTTYMVLGISNKEMKYLPDILIRVGRFEVELHMDTPTQQQRTQILKYMLQQLPLGETRNNHNSEVESTNENPIQTTSASNSTDKAIVTSSIVSNNSNNNSNNKHNRLKLAERWSNILSPRLAGCVAGDLQYICDQAYQDALSKQHQQKFNIQSYMTTYVGLGGNTDGGDGDDNGDGKTHTVKTLPASATTDFLLVADENENQNSNVVVTWNELHESAYQYSIPSQLKLLDVTPPRYLYNKADDNNDAANSKDYKTRHYNIWNTNFGGYHKLKHNLLKTVVGPWSRRISSGNTSTNSNMMVSPPSGILFHGPTGCGKTFAAELLASSLALQMIKIKSTDILDPYLGGSEEMLRSIFARARSASPCVLMFDDLESIVCNRSSSGDEGVEQEVQVRILSTFLNEMDGVSSTSSNSILIVATTQHIQFLDSALLRPGRLEEHFQLDLPSKQDCCDIIQHKLDGLLPLGLSSFHDGNIDQLGQLCVDAKFNCSKIKGMIRDVCWEVIRHIPPDWSDEQIILQSTDLLQMSHFISYFKDKYPHKDFTV